MQVANQDAAIRERAYAIWEAEGRPEGRAFDHWYQAMSEVAGRAELKKATARPAAKTKTPKAPKSVKSRVREALKSALS